MYQQCFTFLLDDKVPTVFVGGEQPRMVLAVSILTALTERCFTSHLPRTNCLCLVILPIPLNPQLSVKLVKKRGNGIMNEGGIRHEQQRYKDKDVDKSCQKSKYKLLKHIQFHRLMLFLIGY